MTGDELRIKLQLIISGEILQYYAALYSNLPLSTVVLVTKNLAVVS